MNLPDCVRTYLDQQQLPYRLIPRPAGETLIQAAERLDISLHEIARVVLLQDAAGLVMAILPGNHILDFSMLYQALKRDLEPLYGDETTYFFQQHGCVAGSHPPLPEAFGILALVDDSLVENSDREIYFDGGSGDSLIGMRNTDFRRLLTRSRWVRIAIAVDQLDFLMSRQALTPKNLTNLANRYAPVHLRQGIEAIADLPAMPVIAQRILAMSRADPPVGVADIIPLLEQEPNLAAHVVYWARSPLHGYHDPVDSLETAIGQVLGIEHTLSLLLGSSMGQAFRIPVDGPIGLHEFWRHSVYCASLVSELAKEMAKPTTVKPELAYLCGLLHDFGFLVLGHVFPARFFLLNRFLAANHNLSFSTVERYILGVEHWHIGAWLMRTWGLPEELISALRWHHSEDCTQPHAEYSNLVLIANRLLGSIGMGEERNNYLPALALFSLGISREQALGTLARVRASMAALDILADALRLPAATVETSPPEPQASPTTPQGSR